MEIIKKAGAFQAKYNLDTKTGFLGEGQYAKVYKAYDSDGKVYAVKVVDTKKLKGPDLEGLKLEVKILGAVDHPRVIKLYDVFEEKKKKKMYLVLELVQGGELFDRIVARDSYSERDAAETVQTIATALKYCHDKKIVHRDLKPENLLLISETDDTSVKLADFGFAAYCHKPLNDGCGTLIYVAPEILRGRDYRTEVDMWSLGVITYILLCGYPPFFAQDQAELSRKIVEGKYRFKKEYWGDISDDAKDLVVNLMKRNPKNRLNADDVLNHPWIQNLAGVSDKPLEKTQKELRDFVAKEKMRKALGTIAVVNALNNLSELSKTEIPEDEEQVLDE